MDAEWTKPTQTARQNNPNGSKPGISHDCRFGRAIARRCEQAGLAFAVRAPTAEAVEQGIRLTPDVILRDIRMPEVGRHRHYGQMIQAGVRARVLMLSTFDRDDYLFNARRAGASGFPVRLRL
jgi:DNA-binding NarL/FixJ family response regulator